jgi:hypothetical protein
MPTLGAVFGMIVFGAIGFAAFLYGKRMMLPRPLIIGVVLMVYPYFVPQASWLYAVGTLLTVGLFYPRP